jgi:hypothetical protein
MTGYPKGAIAFMLLKEFRVRLTVKFGNRFGCRNAAPRLSHRGSLLTQAAKFAFVQSGRVHIDKRLHGLAHGAGALRWLRLHRDRLNAKTQDVNLE